MPAVILIPLVIIGAFVLFVFLSLLLAKRSTPARDQLSLGLVESGDRLHSCPDTPNCVSTFESRDSHHVDPIPVNADRSKAISAARLALEALPRTEILTEAENYIHAESRSALFRFIDDVEVFYPAEGGMLHFRSASRVGKGDLGANRKRYLAFRNALASLI
jgi:uncharacterized protein (DUF1499 family)